MEKTNDIRIGLYLSGEMKGADRASFEREMASDSDLREAVATAQLLWDNAPATDQTSWDTEQAWQRFATEAPGIQRKAMKVRRTLYWAVAATFAIAAGVYSFFFATPGTTTYAYQEGMTAPIELADGSKIYLNKDSELKVYAFTPEQRHLELKGEVYIEVEPDADRPFTVSSLGSLTEVVGTSFNLRQFDGQTQIFVNSGKVIFSEEGNTGNAVALTQGEAAVFGGEEMELIPNPSPNITAWQTRKLHFKKQMALTDIVNDLEDYFDTSIVIENEDSKSCRITLPLSIENPEIRSVLNIIATSINAEVIEEDDSYTIKGGKNCL